MSEVTGFPIIPFTSSELFLRRWKDCHTKKKWTFLSSFGEGGDNGRFRLFAI
jgi:hypothetical protein